MVKRYDMDSDKYGDTCGEMYENKDGDYVLYSDYKELEDKYNDIIRRLESTTSFVDFNDIHD